MSDACVVCGKADGDLVLCGDGEGKVCDAAYHQACMKGCACGCKKKPSHFSAVPDIPEGDWFCKLCRNTLGPGGPGQGVADMGTRVFAFGQNAAGQLGLGRGGMQQKSGTKVQLVPQVVADLCGIRVMQLAAGGWNSLLLTDETDEKEPEAYSCGDGENGKTGHPDLVHEHLTRFQLLEALLPEKRSKGEGPVCTVACGRDFSMALTTEGHCYTWGTGELGKLGHQDFKDRKVPTKMSALRELEIPIKAPVSLGHNHTLVTGEDNGQTVIFSWGSNQAQQLGLMVEDAGTNKWVPQLLNPVRAASYYGMSLVAQRDKDVVFPIRPGEVSGLAAGSMASYATTQEGAVWSWGSGIRGELGLKPPDSLLDGKSWNPRWFVHTPQKVVFSGASTAVQQVRAGATFCIALMRDGTVRSWGQNTAGELGLGLSPQDKPQQYTPELIAGPWKDPNGADVSGTVVDIATGDAHALAVTRSGAVFSWGSGRHGQLGQGDTENRLTPTLIASADLSTLPGKTGQDSQSLSNYPITLICAGGDHSFIVHQAPPKKTKKKKKPAAEEEKPDDAGEKPSKKQKKSQPKGKKGKK